MLSSELTRRHKLGMYTGASGRGHGVDRLQRHAPGQSFGAFAIQGVTLNVTG